METELYGLAFSCPFDKALPSCIFRDLREKSIEKRLEYITFLETIGFSSQFYMKHFKCLNIGEKMVNNVNQIRI